jgi:hypothetical protein
MAVGCMATRVLSGAHYFSDGIGGALVGVISSILCLKLYRHLNQISRRDGASILNSEPSLDYKKRPEWIPVTERGPVKYAVQVIEKAQFSNGVEVSGNVKVSDKARESTGT